MRVYRVIITPAAEADALAAFEYIRERAPLNAARWLVGLYQVIGKLERFAGHGRAAESDWLGVELRQVVFKSHRVLYTVEKEEGIVYVHYVRHGARRGVGEQGEEL